MSDKKIATKHFPALRDSALGDQLETARRFAYETCRQIVVRHAAVWADRPDAVRVTESIEQEIQNAKGTNKSRYESQADRLDHLTSQLALKSSLVNGAAFRGDVKRADELIEELRTICDLALVQQEVVARLRPLPFDEAPAPSAKRVAEICDHYDALEASGLLPSTGEDYDLGGEG